MIVDTHVHVVAPDKERYPLAPVADFRSAGLGPWHVETPVSAEELLETTAGAGVDRAIVVQPFSAYGFDNNYHADSAARYPNRLISVCTVDPTAPEAAERLAYWIDERGMTGLRLTTSREGARLDDERALPLWEQVEALGIPVCVLTTPPHWGEARAMAMRFPRVRVLLDHVGGMRTAESQEQLDELIGLAALPNLHLKVSTVNFAPLVAQGDAGQVRWKRIVSAFGVERLFWGSNYPVSQEGSYADMVELGRRALTFLSDAERERMLGSNAVAMWPQLARGGGTP